MPYVEYDEVEAICSDCGRIFRSEEALELHRRDSHELADAPAGPAAPPPATSASSTRRRRATPP